jgi:hypothetical protein
VNYVLLVEKATKLIIIVWPLSLYNNLPVVISQSYIISEEDNASRVLSAEKATNITIEV